MLWQPELTPEQQERKKKKDAADAHKAKGNDAYKAKKFDEAVTHYEAAIAALPYCREDSNAAASHALHHNHASEHHTASHHAHLHRAMARAAVTR